VLATLLPARRPRYSARKVKSATSRYLNRDDARPATPTSITAIDITVHPPLHKHSRHCAHHNPAAGLNRQPVASASAPS
jgi:hypothetical protein